MSQIFADNLRFLMKSNGIRNVNDLSKRTRIAQPTLFRWLAAEAREPRHSNVLPLAEFFGVSLDDLMRKDLSTGEVPEARVAVMRAHVPVVPFDRVKQADEFMRNTTSTETWPSIYMKRINRRAFATRLEGHAAAPVAQAGDMLIVDPSRLAKDGDWVLAVEPEHHTVVMRRLEHEAGICYLRPADSAYRTIAVHGEPQIIGTICEVQHVTRL